MSGKADIGFVVEGGATTTTKKGPQPVGLSRSGALTSLFFSRVLTQNALGLVGS